MREGREEGGWGNPGGGGEFVQFNYPLLWRSRKEEGGGLETGGREEREVKEGGLGKEGVGPGEEGGGGQAVLEGRKARQGRSKEGRRRNLLSTFCFLSNI